MHAEETKHVLLGEIKPLEIEAWFETPISQPQGKKKSPLTWASVVNVKSVMSQVYKHAQRHEFVELPEKKW